MGQGLGSGIVFEDNYRFSDVDRGGCRIKCNHTFRFTQLTKAAVNPADEMNITCKVYKLEGSPIGLGLVPTGSKDKCSNHLIGTSEIPDSIGCHIISGNVALVKNGNTFFAGDCNTGNPTNIQMSIKNGKVSFSIDGRKVNSSQLDGMTFSGPHYLGVGMTEEDQLVEVYPTCPFTFVDRWTAGRMWSDTMQVKKNCNFTYYSHELIQPSGKYTVVANFRKNCDSSCGLGIVSDSKKDDCQNALVGMFSGSIGFLFKDKMLTIIMNGDVIFASEGNCSDPCLAEMDIDDGKVTFKFDGKELDCSQLASARFNTPFRVGVALSAEDQTVEMRGTIDKSKFIALPKSTIRWKDNMRSINCDGQDFLATSRKDFPATVHSQQVVDAEENEQVEIRVLKNPDHGAMIIGLIDSDPEGHANNIIGHPDLKNSIGLTNGGNVVLRGEVKPSSGVGFMDGDLVKITLQDKALRIYVNGKDAAPHLHKLGLKNKFRYAVSFTKEGQAVKIGSSTLTSNEREFCRDQSVRDPLDSALSDSTRAEKLGDLLRRAGFESSKNGGLDAPLCWKDNMRSVDCDRKDLVAVSVKSFTATLFMQKVVPVTGSSVQVQVRILNNPNDASMLVGAMGEDTDGHANNHLGESGFGNSIGLTNRGKVLLKGSRHGDLGPGFKAGDLVTMTLGGGKLKIRINGVDAAPGLDSLNFTSAFRFAVSFTTAGQAVKIGSDVLTEGEQMFLLEKSIHQVHEKPPTPGSATPTCPTGHPTVHKNIPNPWICNTCMSHFITDTPSFRCDFCDYDMCPNCWDKKKGSGSGGGGGTTSSTTTSTTSTTHTTTASLATTPTKPTTPSTNSSPKVNSGSTTPSGPASPAKPPPSKFNRHGFGGHAAPRYMPPLELVKNFTPDPSKTCGAYILEDAARELGPTVVPCLQQIVAESGRITQSLLQSGVAPPQLTPPQLFAIVCYTFDMKLIDPDAESSTNFYAQLNLLLQTRNATRIAHLRGYLYYLMSGLQALPEHKGIVYRGLDSHGLEIVQKYYRKAAKVHWSSMSSTTLEYEFAKQMAGSGGIVLKIEVTGDARVLGEASALPDEMEVLALPSFGAVVMSDIYTTADGTKMLDLHECPKEQVLDQKAAPMF